MEGRPPTVMVFPSCRAREAGSVFARYRCRLEGSDVVDWIAKLRPLIVPLPLAPKLMEGVSTSVSLGWAKDWYPTVAPASLPPRTAVPGGSLFQLMVNPEG